ncbi:FecR family protein [Emticicia sp. BO119]|uniref:FecR family protein n=1 Tax=Emticicia sp. BO119 TaxID=2757768 RepID=UPI0015F00EC5|nr:FecR family protein [Emticicia sp. BO119]MBA4850186.1 FecR family protein [Emticicia sp. BO119]
MNLDYRNYSFEDFSRDDSFRQWVFNPDNKSELFWTNWIAQNPDCVESINSAKAFLLTLHEKEIALDDDELDIITASIIKENGVKIPFWKTQVFRIAASIAIISSIAFFGLRYYADTQKTAFLEKINPSLTNNYFETENQASEAKKITLEDGSIVTLYPKSRIRYPKQFSEQAREVYLAGQAFFEITKNPKQPFWVYTNYISTQVLGTSFMVKAFDNDKNVKVEVHSGKVSVYSREDLEKAKLQKKNELAGIILTPNQVIDYSITEARLLKSINKHPEILSSESPKNFVFDEAPIAKVFEQLENSYGIHIIYDEKNMENCYLTASFSDESLYEKLNLICKITHSTYEMVDAQIVIHSNGC